MGLPRHPDTIPNLAPDCRRYLRYEYMEIQAIPKPDQSPQLVNLGETEAECAARHREAKEEHRRKIAAAIAEYKRVAKMWGVDV